MARVLWRKEREKFLKALERPEQPDRIRRKALFLLAYDTGARVAELEALDLKDFDRQRKTIHLINVKMKGHPVREVPLHHKTFLAVNAWLRIRPDAETDALFVSRQGRRLTKRRMQQEYEELCRMAGIVPRGIHTLRHTAATRWLDDKILQVHQASRRLGHGSISTTQKYYVHGSVEAEADAIDKSTL
jgi:integrase